MEIEESVNLEIYNMVGNKVMEINNGYQGSGTYSQELNISSLSNGMYFLRILAGETQVIKKIQVMN